MEPYGNTVIYSRSVGFDGGVANAGNGGNNSNNSGSNATNGNGGIGGGIANGGNGGSFNKDHSVAGVHCGNVGDGGL